MTECNGYIIMQLQRMSHCIDNLLVLPSSCCDVVPFECPVVVMGCSKMSVSAGSDAIFNGILIYLQEKKTIKIHSTIN